MQNSKNNNSYKVMEVLVEGNADSFGESYRSESDMDDDDYIGTGALDDGEKKAFVPDMDDDDYIGTGALDDKDEKLFRPNTSSVGVLRLQGENGQIYTITQQRLGKGGQAMIYPCVGSDGKEYVIKIYRMDKIQKDKLISVLDKLKQGNIPTVTRIIEHGNLSWSGQECYYAIMPRYQNMDMDSYAFSKNIGNREHEELVKELIRSLNSALTFLHNSGIFHGDVKPQNIMWNGEENCAVLIDYGASVSTDREGRRRRAVAKTDGYLPQEAQGVYVLDAWVDYFSMGVTIAEFLDNTYPKNIDILESEVGEVSRIGNGYFGVPKRMKGCYKNLINGLLYEHPERAERIQRRWNSGDVTIWLTHMDNGDERRAATYKGVQGNVQGMNTQTTGQRQSAYQFVNGQVLNLTIDGENFPCNNLIQMVDIFAEHWSGGMQLMLQNDREEQFDYNKMGKDLYRSVHSAKQRIQKIDRDRYESRDAEYFRFLYKYISDKEVFRWKDLPGVTDKESFGMMLLATLDNVRKNGGNFGEWWINMYENSKAKSTVFAEIFTNRIFSEYLKANKEADAHLLMQCDEVEAIFQNASSSYSVEDICEMYLLAYEILGEKTRVYTTDNGTEYESYEDFAKEVKACLMDKKDVDRLFTIWKSVTEGQYYRPDFYAWVRKYSPQYAKSIKHNLNIK